MITRKDFLKVKNSPEFKNFEVSQNSRGTVQIKIADVGTNWINYKNANAKGIVYQIGYNEQRGEYWIRRQNGRYITPMHYNKQTGNYGFATFDEALEYLKRSFIRTGKNKMPVENEIIKSEIYRYLELAMHKLSNNDIHPSDDELNAAFKWFMSHKDNTY